MTAVSKALIILMVIALCSLAEARSASLNEINAAQRQSQNIVDAFNVIYPDLELAVAAPAAEAVLIKELEVLRSALHGTNTQNGILIHLACCAAACGGDGCGKK